MPNEKRLLKVFLCHASQDKPIVRELYRRLNAEGWIDPWLDVEKLLPGQDWELEIEKAVEAADAVIMFLSNNSVTKEGFVQKELRFVLGVADYMPEGKIFLIPIKLNDCTVPRPLLKWQYVDYFPKEQEERAYQRLVDALRSNFPQKSDRIIVSEASVPRAQVSRFISIPLTLAQQPNGTKAPGTNAYNNLGLKPGQHTLNDIPFSYEYEVYTQNSDEPHFPQVITIPFRVTNPVCLYFIIQADWGLSKYLGHKLGKIVVKFESNESFEYSLVLGKNIRDWSRGSSHIAVDRISSPDVTNAWIGYAPGGKKGGMDLLTINLPTQFQNRVITSINIADTTLDTTGDYNPGIHLLAATAKFIEDAG